MKIFLADLHNTHFRQSRGSIPLGMGYVSGYLTKRFGSDISQELFITFEALHDRLREETPHLIAFGSYSWNTCLTQNSVRFLRARFPQLVIAVGGPDVNAHPRLLRREFGETPEVDFFLPNEGEAPMANLVEAALGCPTPELVRKKRVVGCFRFDRETGELVGEAIDRFPEDINAIPSPYLEGILDPFLTRTDLLPIVQTSRGCPYHCTFCVSGKETWSKVRMFDMERVKAEIDYIAQRTPRYYLRFADENFGLLERDVEIARHIATLNETRGFPRSISLYTDKRPTERVKTINLILKKLLPFNISFQTTTPHVLENIRRINLKEKVIHEAIAFCKEHDLLPVSELIFALPGESLASFLDAVDLLVRYRFESIFINQLRILKGTHMDLPEDRGAHAVKTMFAMSENGLTRHPHMENIEIDEWVVENATMSRDDYFFGNRLIFLFDFLHGRAFAKELLFFFENYGISPSLLLMTVLRQTDLAPLLARQAIRFEEELTRRLFATPDLLRAHIRQHFDAEQPDYSGVLVAETELMIEILATNRLAEVVEELAVVGRHLYHQRQPGDAGDFEEALRAVSNLAIHALVDLSAPAPERIPLLSSHDLAAWVGSKYEKPLEEYRLPAPRPFHLEIREIRAYEEIWAEQADLVERFRRHFSVINSANRRRFVARA